MSADKINRNSSTGAKTKAIIIVGIVIAAFILLNILSGGKILSPKNLDAILSSAVVPTLTAFGFLIVFTGNVTDLSPGSIVILTSTAAGLLANAYGIPAAIIGCILLGIVCMVFNFTVYRITKVPPWIAALGMTMVYESFAVMYANYCASKGQKIVVMDQDLRFLGHQPGIYICGIIGIIIAYIIFNKTSLGINFRATGDNEDVAKIMGINVDKALILGGVVAGAFFGYAGVVQESYAGFVYAMSGLTSLSTTFQPMAAALLALALANYINAVIAVPISTILITAVFNVLPIFGVPSGTFQNAILGLIVIFFAILAQRNVKGVVK